MSETQDLVLGTLPALTVMEVTPNLEIGGAQETVRTLAGHLPSAGCRVVVCSFGDGPLARDIERLGVPIEFLPPRRHGVLALPVFLIEMARRRRDLLAIIARHGVDVVQTQGLGTLDFLVMTLRRRGLVQVWWTIQNAEFMVREEHLGRHRWLLGAKRAAHRWLYRAGARIVDGIIVVSDATARSFLDTVGHVEDKITVVYNAVDLDRYPAPIDRSEVRAGLGFGAEAHLMTMVGTFKRQKGHRHLVAAAAAMVPRFPTLHILLVGDGELADEVRLQVQAAGLSDHVHFLGTRRDVPELLSASDSFVLPSLWEGLPVALTEAMASGLPVVATDVSGTSQVVIDGESGLLVPPGDAEALAEAMNRLLSDPALASRMAVSGRERVSASFAASAQAEHLAALFRRSGLTPPPISTPATSARGAR
jgi:glycosyltransferase involved in cell wall biosynthesis